MKCLVEFTGRENDKGWREYVCKRCGKGKNAFTPDAPEKWRGSPWVCVGKLILSDWPEAISGIMEGLGLDEVAARLWFLDWRRKGSPLDQLPPGVPSPDLPPPNAGLSAAEVSELFPGEDPTLLGNRIKALTTALGIPTCGGCEARRDYLNKAHAWLRS